MDGELTSSGRMRKHWIEIFQSTSGITVVMFNEYNGIETESNIYTRDKAHYCYIQP